MSKVMRATVIVTVAVGVAAVGLIALSVRDTGYHKFVVGSTSCMSPTINSGELVFVKPFNPTQDRLKRYQIILFRSPPAMIPNGMWTMRIIGLPDEEVEIRTNSFVINRSQLAEKELPAILKGKEWLPARLLEPSERRQWTLGSDEVFVIGDNLGSAYDSRYWGPLNVSNVIGVVEKKANGKRLEIHLDPVLPVRTTVTVQDGDARTVDRGE